MQGGKIGKGDKTNLKAGKVYLTGGGCGDAGLLTWRALEVLRFCDVLVYDSLVSEELLEFTKDGCEKIYVGKRYGKHTMKQPEINLLLVDQARKGKMVVRLKGGDPYVFGRGGEEFLALKKAGIFCEEIPGISSAIAVPAAAGIPVTHRGISASVTVVTGTAAEENGKEQLRMDFGTLARLDGTLVILMGMHHLEEIAAGLIGAGKKPDTPCAVIMDGTTRRQRCMRTVLSKLPMEASVQGFTSPAVIVIGAVAGMELVSCGSVTDLSGTYDKRNELEERMMENQPDESGKPLSKITVGVTGTPRFAAKLSAAFQDKGADVWDMSFMEVRPADNPLPDLTGYGWLVFTSPNGVLVFLEQMKRERKDLRMLYGKRIAVIGPGTAEVLEKAGLYADYMPSVYDGEHLAKGLAKRILSERNEGQQAGEAAEAIFLRAREGSGQLPMIFDREGILFVDYPLYEVGVLEEKRAKSVVKQPDYIVFGSAAGVRAYFEGVSRAGLNHPKARYVCIGEQCGKELRKYTADAFLAAEKSSVEALVECVCREQRQKTNL